MIVDSRRLFALALLFATAAVAIAVLVVDTTRGAPSSSAATRQLIGHSVRGRAIYAYRLGDPSGTPVLVVGSIHGNEPPGSPSPKGCFRVQAPATVDLWVILELNPTATRRTPAGTRTAVDLNRNFPWRWRRLSGGFLFGPAQSLRAGVAGGGSPGQANPAQTHDLVPPATGPRRRAKDAACSRTPLPRLTGLPLEQLRGLYPGTATSWERHIIPGAVAFVTELPKGKAQRARVDRFVRAVLTVAASWADGTSHYARHRRARSGMKTRRLGVDR